MSKKAEFMRTVKFTLFSISAGAIQLVTFELMYSLWRLPWWPSYLTALILSVIWNFTFNRKFTFRSANNVPIAMLEVLLYYAVFTPVSTLFGNWLEQDLLWNGTLVTIINMLLNFVTEYLFDRFVVFRDSIDTNVKAG